MQITPETFRKFLQPWMRVLIPYICAVAGYGGLWTLQRYALPLYPTSVTAQVAKIVCDAAIVFVFYWLAGPRWRRWWLIVPIWLVAIYVICNLIYAKNFETLIPFTSFFSNQSYNPYLLTSAWNAVGWSEVAALLCAVAVTVVAAWPGLASAVMPRRYGYIGAGLSVAAFAAIQLNYAILYEEIARQFKPDMTVLERAERRFQEVRDKDWQYVGLAYYLAGGITDALINGRTIQELTPENEQDINDFLSSQPELPRLPEFAGNARKNLIFVTMESLNSDAINATDTPVLDSLLRTPGTISALNVVTQTGHGHSADGHLIMLSGQLPLRTGAAANLFPHNAIPALPHILKGYESVEIIGGIRTCLSHQIISPKYGFARLEAMDMLPGRESGHDMDRRLFDYSLTTLKGLKQPFITHITTISMHTPFREPAAENHESSDLQQRYTGVLRYCDRELGRFLRGLHDAGLFDNSIVVIASDHHEKSGDNDTGPHPILFMALNTGLSRSIDVTVAQSDIFPTLLQIMDRTDAPWKGLGVSMLTSGYECAVANNGTVYGTPTDSIVARRNRAMEIGDLMISTDYFKFHPID